MPGWKRQETKDVSPTGESTYKNVSEARESKMPGGSCDRKLSSRSLKATRVEIDQIFRVGPTPCPLPPPLPEPWFQLPALEICPARLNKDQSSSSIEQRLYLAASRWGMANEEEENVRLEEAGKKKKMPLQPAKVRTMLPAEPGSRRCQAAALSVHWNQDLWKAIRNEIDQVFKVGSISCLIAHRH